VPDQDDTTSPTTAFLGLGNMGAPMAARLALVGRPLVWARRPEVAVAHSEAHGSKAVPFDEIFTAEVIVTCLPTSADVEDLCDLAGELLRAGTLWVDCTSGDPAASRELAQRLEEVGVAFVDAPVSGGVEGAELGTLTSMVGGSAEDFARARPVLEAFCRRLYHLGPVGAGHAMKSVNNALTALSYWATAEGIHALQGAGVDPALALDVINASSGRSTASEIHATRRLRGEESLFAIGLMAKDVRIAGSVAREHLVAAPVLALADQLYDLAARLVGPEKDFLEAWAVVEHFRSTAATALR
jgi:3-hydroxyisobutyrate dehydrogenase